MKVAILSDIHGNGLAFEAVLADLRKHPADQCVCLGDAVQGGPQPAEVVARLRELACPVVMGNADAWLLIGKDEEHTTEEQVAVREWSLAQLTDADHAFVAGFQPTVEIELEGGERLLCFHGSPTSFNDVIFPDTPDEKVWPLLEQFASAILTGGHTHLQQIRRIGETFFFNPGSIGLVFDMRLPRDMIRFNAWAEYALLSSEGDRVSLEFRRVPYDVDALIEVYRSCGRPHSEPMIVRYK